MDLFIFGWIVFLISFVIYSEYIDKKYKCILKQISNMDNGTEKDNLLKEKNKIEVKLLITTIIYVIFVLLVITTR